MWSVTATAPSCTRVCRMSTGRSFFRTASEWPFQSRRNLRDRHAVATPPTNLTARCTARGTNGTQVRMPQESFPDGFEVHAQADKIRCLARFPNLTFAGSQLEKGCLSQQQLVLSRVHESYAKPGLAGLYRCSNLRNTCCELKSPAVPKLLSEGQRWRVLGALATCNLKFAREKMPDLRPMFVDAQGSVSEGALLSDWLKG